MERFVCCEPLAHHRSFYIISIVFLVRHLFILCALTSVAGVAEGLEILNVETRSALIDGDNVVNHLGGVQTTRFEALLAHRLLLQLQGSELSPGCALVELSVVVAVALEGFSLRQPGSRRCAFQFRHITE